MFKRNSVYGLVAGLLLLSLGVIACGDTTTAVAPAAATSTAGAKAGASKAVEDAVKLQTRLDTLTSTLVLKDVKQAKVLVTEFDDAWGKVEDGIKDRSADTYKKVEEKLDNMKAVIVKTDNPDLDKSKQAVKELNDTFAEFVKSQAGK